jgi:acetyl-CoA acetyltransferase
MKVEQAYIPYGAYWSTPFCRWQGSFSNLHAIRFAAEIAKRAMAERELDPSSLDALFLGTTVPAPSSFYGGPWLAGMIGAEGIGGTMIGQACATGARVIASAAYEVEIGAKQGIEPIILGVTADRTSNGPHLVYPNPLAPGARPDTEDWVWDNFGKDPFARNAMIVTAENVAKEEGITTEAQHEVVVMRHQQYQAALEDDSAFLKRFMPLPVEVNPTGRKVIAEVTGDEGVFPTTAEGLKKLKPVLPDGSVTYGGQTFPADGNAGVIVTSKGKAAKLSRDSKIEVQLLAYSEGRAKKGSGGHQDAQSVCRQRNLPL